MHALAIHCLVQWSSTGVNLGESSPTPTWRPNGTHAAQDMLNVLFIFHEAVVYGLRAV